MLLLFWGSLTLEYTTWQPLKRLSQNDLEKLSGSEFGETTWVPEHPLGSFAAFPSRRSHFLRAYLKLFDLEEEWIDEVNTRDVLIYLGHASLLQGHRNLGQNASYVTCSRPEPLTTPVQTLI